MCNRKFYYNVVDCMDRYSTESIWTMRKLQAYKSFVMLHWEKLYSTTHTHNRFWRLNCRNNLENSFSFKLLAHFIAFGNILQTCVELLKISNSKKASYCTGIFCMKASDHRRCLTFPDGKPIYTYSQSIS